jgi:hypothetical protein
MLIRDSNFLNGLNRVISFTAFLISLRGIIWVIL